MGRCRSPSQRELDLVSSSPGGVVISQHGQCSFRLPRACRLGGRLSSRHFSSEGSVSEGALSRGWRMRYLVPSMPVKSTGVAVLDPFLNI